MSISTNSVSESLLQRRSEIAKVNFRASSLVEVITGCSMDERLSMKKLGYMLEISCGLRCYTKVVQNDPKRQSAGKFCVYRIVEL